MFFFFGIGVRRHVCEICGRSYVQSQHLNRHKRYECGIEPQFKCEFCPYKAKRKQHLKAHCVIKHSYFIVKSWYLQLIFDLVLKRVVATVFFFFFLLWMLHNKSRTTENCISTSIMKPLYISILNWSDFSYVDFEIPYCGGFLLHCCR